MKLAKAIKLAQLNVRTDQSITAKQLTHRIFQLAAAAGTAISGSERDWKNRWLSSDEFFLTEIDLGKVAVPRKGISLSAAADEPIAVDLNKQSIGSTPGGFTPSVIVIEGQLRHHAATSRGQGKIQAYVGCEVMNRLHPVFKGKIDAPVVSHVSRLEAAAMLSVPRQDIADEKQSAPHKPLPKFIQDRGILSNSNTFKYNGIAPGTGVGPRDDDGTEITMKPSKGGSKSELNDVDAAAVMIKEMHDDIKGGKFKFENSMMGVAPPGRESQVVELKKKYGEDSPVPFQISWHQYNKGKK